MRRRSHEFFDSFACGAEVSGGKKPKTNYIQLDGMSGSLDLARVWLINGEKQHAEDIVMGIATNACEYLQWYSSLSKKVQDSCAQDILYNVYQLNASVEILKDAQSENHKTMEEALQIYHVMFQDYLYR